MKSTWVYLLLWGKAKKLVCFTLKREYGKKNQGMERKAYITRWKGGSLESCSSGYSSIFNELLQITLITLP